MKQLGVFMEKYYRGQVYGSVLEIDENQIENEIYLLVSFEEEPYNVWDCIHNQAGFRIMTGLEDKFSLLTNENEKEIIKTINDEQNIKNKKHRINLYSVKDQNYIVELEAKVLTERIRFYNKELYRLIKNWLANVYERAEKHNKDMIKTTNWFERVYTFIKTGQKTRYKEIIEVFKMSEYLYKRFDFYFEAKEKIKL